MFYAFIWLPEKLRKLYRALLLFKKGPYTKKNRFKIQACGSSFLFIYSPFVNWCLLFTFLEISIAFVLKLYSLNVKIIIIENRIESNRELANRNRIGTSKSIPSPSMCIIQTFRSVLHAFLVSHVVTSHCYICGLYSYISVASHHVATEYNTGVREISIMF